MRKKKKKLTQRSPMQKALLKESGKVRIKSKLVSFLYELMRDHVPPGDIQSILEDSQHPDVTYTNGYLAKYAEFVAEKLQ